MEFQYLVSSCCNKKKFESKNLTFSTPPFVRTLRINTLLVIVDIIGSSYPKQVLIWVSLSPVGSKYEKKAFLSHFPSQFQSDTPLGILKTWLLLTLASLGTLLNLTLISLLAKKHT